MFERIDRILGSGFKGWINTEDDTNDESSKESDGKNLPADKWCEWSKSRENKSQNVA